MTSQTRRPRIGTVEWEHAGGPPLSSSERLALLAGAGGLVVSHVAQRARWRLARMGLARMRLAPKVDLDAWASPDSRAARDAEAFLRSVSSPQMVNHSFRTYYFSAILYQLSTRKPALDREALYVAALMHDVGLFDPSPPPAEHCFTVGCAREARRIASAAGWEAPRADRMAMAITSNLNPHVPAEIYGPEAHFMSVGGRVEVLAQEWKIHPDNLAEILARYPRKGFAADALGHVEQERRRNPGCRFACLHPLFPFMVRHSSFTLDERTSQAPR